MYYSRFRRSCKTFEALAIIKYFEIGMNRVLVLTPAKLYDNWNSFRGDYKYSFKGNIQLQNNVSYGFVQI